MREFSHETGRELGKEGPEKREGHSQQKRTVSRRGQSREGYSQQKRTVSRREQKRTIGRGEQLEEGQLRDESRAERRPVNRSQKGGH